MNTMFNVKYVYLYHVSILLVYTYMHDSKYCVNDTNVTFVNSKYFV